MTTIKLKEYFELIHVNSSWGLSGIVWKTLQDGVDEPLKSGNRFLEIMFRATVSVFNLAGTFAILCLEKQFPARTHVQFKGVFCVQSCSSTGEGAFMLQRHLTAAFTVSSTEALSSRSLTSYCFELLQFQNWHVALWLYLSDKFYPGKWHHTELWHSQPDQESRHFDRWTRWEGETFPVPSVVSCIDPDIDPADACHLAWHSWNTTFHVRAFP